MKQFAVFLVVMGLGSAILPLLGLQFRLLAWIDMWGVTAAWSIRGVLVLVGVCLLAYSAKAVPSDPAGATDSDADVTE